MSVAAVSGWKRTGKGSSPAHPPAGEAVGLPVDRAAKKGLELAKGRGRPWLLEPLKDPSVALQFSLDTMKTLVSRLVFPPPKCERTPSETVVVGFALSSASSWGRSTSS